jgi:predicted CopG family antitoxin
MRKAFMEKKIQNLEVLGIASWRQNKKLKKPKKNQKNQRKPLTIGLGDGGVQPGVSKYCI